MINDEMTLMIFDEDIDEADVYGGALIQFKDICTADGIDDWITLKYKGENVGQVRIRTKWIDYSKSKKSSVLHLT